MEWKTLQLGELIEYRNGLWAGKDGDFTRAKVIRVTEMRDNGSYDLSTAKELQVETRKLATRQVVPNSILLERSGGGENKPVGRVVLFGEDVKKDLYSFSNFTTLLLPKEDLVLPKYLFYALYFFHLSGKTKLLQKAVTGIRNLEFGKYLEQEIVLPFKNGKPDLAEQKRIANRLDEVFVETEKSINVLAKNMRLANKVGASAMRQLLTISKLDEIELGKILNLQNGRAFKETDWSTKGLPIVRIQNLNNPNAKFNHYEEKIEDRFLIENGDLLISWSGTPGTSFGAFIWQRGKAILNQHIFNAVPMSSKLSKRYLRYAVSEKLDEMILSAHGGVGLRHITKTDLVKVKLPIPLKNGEPDLERQESIADELDKLFSYSKQLSSLIEKQQGSFISFRSSMLNQSFQIEPAKLPIVSPIQPVAAPRIFDIQQAVAHILKRFERGEMVVAKILYLGQVLFGVPTNIQFSAQNFGPYDTAVKKAVTAGLSPRNKFFAKKGSGSNQVLTLGTNANNILKYSTSALARKTNMYLDQMLPLLNQSDSADIERLATLCKIIEDERTADEAVIKAKLQDWKPNKFTDEETSRTLAFIKKQGWDQTLLK